MDPAQYASLIGRLDRQDAAFAISEQRAHQSRDDLAARVSAVAGDVKAMNYTLTSQDVDDPGLLMRMRDLELEAARERLARDKRQKLWTGLLLGGGLINAIATFVVLSAGMSKLADVLAPLIKAVGGIKG
jgi:hypothetical protein